MSFAPERCVPPLEPKSRGGEVARAFYGGLVVFAVSVAWTAPYGSSVPARTDDLLILQPWAIRPPHRRRASCDESGPSSPKVVRRALSRPKKIFGSGGRAKQGLRLPEKNRWWRVDPDDDTSSAERTTDEFVSAAHDPTGSGQSSRGAWIERNSLDSALWQLAAQVRPVAEDKSAKAAAVHRIAAAARAVLGPDANAMPFGSSANGFGEKASDIDIVLHVPHSCNTMIPRGQILKSVAEECVQRDFRVTEVRRGAKVPIVMLVDLQGNYEIDLSCENLLPLVNTQLLRTYVELEPTLYIIVAAVKRWAKHRRIAKSWEGFISSYAWTLMVVYYMQVCHGLPSVHVGRRAEAQAYQHLPLRLAGKRGFGAKRHEYRLEFEDVEMVRPQWNGIGLRVGAILRGFFKFFSSDFAWQSEVVSVRLGQRINLPSSGLQLVGLNMEDPIDITRNLNFALTPASVANLRREIDEAMLNLEDNMALEEFIGLPKLVDPIGGSRKMQPAQEGFLDLPEDLDSLVGGALWGTGSW